ncbi:adhesion G-protein coupled receptor D1-like [Xenia sp. Carnegie-2017]|uniref:adhesion G-protein coupled receptor D1-like n=1 Tax=Xenia sp. Carnegie-2017 TaxID=2897299 RepID=UPI001F04A7EE|nr:adhesion G-protein coupled receptor D1-like [Xenia sp. Carnegie-2017]
MNFLVYLLFVLSVFFKDAEICADNGDVNIQQCCATFRGWTEDEDCDHGRARVCCKFAKGNFNNYERSEKFCEDHCKSRSATVSAFKRCTALARRLDVLKWCSCHKDSFPSSTLSPSSKTFQSTRTRTPTITTEIKRSKDSSTLATIKATTLLSLTTSKDWKTTSFLNEDFSPSSTYSPSSKSFGTSTIITPTTATEIKSSMNLSTLATSKATSKVKPSTTLSTLTTKDFSPSSTYSSSSKSFGTSTIITPTIASEIKSLMNLSTLATSKATSKVKPSTTLSTLTTKDFSPSSTYSSSSKSFGTSTIITPTIASEIKSLMNLSTLATSKATSKVKPSTTLSTLTTKETRSPREKLNYLKKDLKNITLSRPKAFEMISSLVNEFLRENPLDAELILHLPTIFEDKLVELISVANQSFPHRSMTRNEKEFVVSIVHLSSNVSIKEKFFNFPNVELNGMQHENLMDSISIPLSLFDTVAPFFVGVLYHNFGNQSSSANFTDQMLKSNIISAKLVPKPTVTFNISYKLHTEKHTKKPFCAFLNTSSDTSFSTEGCYVISYSNDSTECTCNHMTSFGVIVKNEDDEMVQSKHRKALTIITYVGLTFSLLGDVLTVLSYVILIGLKSEQSHLHINLAFSLALAQTFFIVGISSNGNEVCISCDYQQSNCFHVLCYYKLFCHFQIFCLIVASLIHYFYLVTFCWMFFEGYHLYLMIVKVFNDKSKVKFYYIFSWVTPLIVVISSLISAEASFGIYGYLSDGNFCWISYENNFIWFFIAPALLICLINIIMASLVLREMYRMNKKHTVKISVQFRKSLKACLYISPILGFTWVFGVLVIIKHSLAVEYIFTILNTFQGFFIFLFYVLRSSEIQSAFKQKKERWTMSMYVTNRPSICKKTTGKAPRNLITPVKGYVIESSKCQRRALSTEANKHDQVKSANWQNLQYTSNVEGSGNKVRN